MLITLSVDLQPERNLYLLLMGGKKIPEGIQMGVLNNHPVPCQASPQHTDRPPFLNTHLQQILSALSHAQKSLVEFSLEHDGNFCHIFVELNFLFKMKLVRFC